MSIPADLGFAELQDLFAAGARNDTFDRWLNRRRLFSKKLVAELVDVYRAHDPALVPFPDVSGVLSSLADRYRLGLLSDGHLGVQRRKLRALALGAHFEAIVFSDEWGRSAWKPSSLPFEIILERLGLSGPQAIYVADNPGKDFLGARRVGMSTVRFVSPEGIYAHLTPPSPAHAPDIEIHDLRDLPLLLTGRLTHHTGRRCARLTTRRTLNILLTSVGRRVELLLAFRRGVRRAWPDGPHRGRGYRPDWRPASRSQIGLYLVPPVSSPDDVPTLLRVCRQEQVGLVLPLIPSRTFRFWLGIATTFESSVRESPCCRRRLRL